MIRNQITKNDTSGSTVAMRQQIFARQRRRAKGTPKLSTVAVYASVFALIIAVVAVSYRQPQQSGSAAASAVVPSSQNQQASVDEVVASSIAADVATATNLSIAPNVTNLAASTVISSELAQSSDAVITKPQILAPTADSRSMRQYVTVAGDTVVSVAARFGLSPETIKWANNLSTDAISVGSTLKIMPVNGISYTVKSGDTVDSIAQKYQVLSSRIVTYNDLEEGGLQIGSTIILPDATLPTIERPGYVAPVVAQTTFIAGYSAGFGDGRTWFIAYGTPDNGLYAHGNCTLYAFNRRQQLGLPIGDRWGNASTWAVYARAAGLAVNNTPSVGAIMQNGGGAGHVSIVEEVMPNGDLSISEMNAYVAGGGYNIVSGRIVSAAYVGQYLYIH
jgi:surface antigen/LysM repeat protein